MMPRDCDPKRMLVPSQGAENGDFSSLSFIAPEGVGKGMCVCVTRRGHGGKRAEEGTVRG